MPRPCLLSSIAIYLFMATSAVAIEENQDDPRGYCMEDPGRKRDRRKHDCCTVEPVLCEGQDCKSCSYDENNDWENWYRKDCESGPCGENGKCMRGAAPYPYCGKDTSSVLHGRMLRP